MIPRAEFFTLPLGENGDSVSSIEYIVKSHLVNGRPPERKFQGRSPDRNIAFQSKQMHELVLLAKQFAASSASVLVTGESGTGKELFSRLIHEKSGRPKDRFVAVNCAAIPEQLIESEIFGHERGAFTGAVQKRAGYFERAHEGTLLLDEISEIPLALQAKLLRVIEEQEFQPLGGEQPRRIDVRIVATSNRDLKNEVDEGRFRSDLYHRLNVLDLQIPPLRERKPDIPLLVMHFVEMYRHESKNGIDRVTKEAMQKLCEYHWPGNVRELRNTVHRACILSTDRQITPDQIRVCDSPANTQTPARLTGLPLAEVERKLIIASLRKFGGNKKSAAAELGVTARTLSNKIKQYRDEGHFAEENNHPFEFSANQS
jgi:DNA-binding NtrC family response regulator